MDIPNILVKLVIALICAGIAEILIPRRVPGGIVGLILIGLAGIWFGEWSFLLLRREFGLNFAFLYWQIRGVLIIPAILGCTIVLYLLTAFMSWARYSRS